MSLTRASAAVIKTEELVNNRNKIINGAMEIDQRNAGAAVTISSNQYTLDRWQAIQTQTSKFSVQQSTTAPDGFKNSLLVTSLSAYSVTSSDTFYVRHNFEGLNTYDLSFGTASAKTITLSFWVRSSLTGTFGGSFENNTGRSYPFSYVISSADTWEQKTITAVGDTSGTWLTTNGVGLRVTFSMGTGSTLSGTAGAWSGTANYKSSTGATSVVGTNGATFYITGVQLEVGSVATPFERRPYGTELSLCQRYFEKSYAQGTAVGTATGVGMVGWYGVQTQTTTGEIGIFASYKVTKRADPTVVIYDPAGTSGKCQRVNAGVASYSNEVITIAGDSDDSTLLLYSSTSVNATTGVVCHFTASAEL